MFLLDPSLFSQGTQIFFSIIENKNHEHGQQDCINNACVENKQFFKVHCRYQT